MAIVEMQKLSIYGSKKHRKQVLEYLQERGVMEVSISDAAADTLPSMDTSGDRARFIKIADEIDSVIALLEPLATEERKKILNLEKGIVTRDEVTEVVSDRTTVYTDAKKVLKLDRDIMESRAAIARKNNKIAALRPWERLDIPLNSSETKSTRIFIGTVPGSVNEEKLMTYVAGDSEELLPAQSYVVSNLGQQTNICVIAKKSAADEVERNLRSNGFSFQPFLSTRVPAAAIERRQNDIKSEEAKIEAATEQIRSYVGELDRFRIAADYYRSRAEKYRVLGELPQSDSVFFIEGWTPMEMSEELVLKLEQDFGVAVELEDTREDEIEKEPVLLRNNRFAESAEGVLESYGLPQHGRVDPTFVMSIFYVFFFGMMLSDAAYGIIMSIGTAIVLKKYPRMSKGTSKMLRLFFWCGISTAFWGFMFGGFFGDAIDVIAHTFFGVPEDVAVLKPLWFAPLEDPMRLLVWCMLFGLIHLYAGLGMKGYELLKAGDVKGFICDIVSWYLFITGLVLMLLPSQLFASIAQMSITFPAWVTALAKIITIVGMGTIILMSGRGRKNWGLRIALGLYDIYGITSWLSDVLSYSRLLALGLATGVIASVINSMASMKGASVLGVIIFIVVFIFGHILNMAINLLGAYVHTNRLQFVEFFGKFYDAGGEPMRPFKTVNNYIEIKEDI